jgi:hypothetical protein
MFRPEGRIEEYRLEVTENRVLKRIFRSKRLINRNMEAIAERRIWEMKSRRLR